MNPIACVRCGDINGPFVPTPNGPVCEDCHQPAPERAA